MPYSLFLIKMFLTNGDTIFWPLKGKLWMNLFTCCVLVPFSWCTFTFSILILQLILGVSWFAPYNSENDELSALWQYKKIRKSLHKEVILSFANLICRNVYAFKAYSLSTAKWEDSGLQPFWNLHGWLTKRKQYKQSSPYLLRWW